MGVSDVMRQKFKTGRYQRKFKRDTCLRRLWKGISRGVEISETMRRKFERSRLIRSYEKEIQDKQMSHNLWKENSRAAHVSEVRRRKFERGRCRSNYFLRIIFCTIWHGKLFKMFFMVTSTQWRFDLNVKYAVLSARRKKVDLKIN